MLPRDDGPPRAVSSAVAASGLPAAGGRRHLAGRGRRDRSTRGRWLRGRRRRRLTDRVRVRATVLVGAPGSPFRGGAPTTPAALPGPFPQVVARPPDGPVDGLRPQLRTGRAAPRGAERREVREPA